VFFVLFIAVLQNTVLLQYYLQFLAPLVSTACTWSILYLHRQQTDKIMSCLEKLDMNSDCLQGSKFEIILFMTSVLYDVKIQHKVGNCNVIRVVGRNMRTFRKFNLSLDKV